MTARQTQRTTMTGATTVPSGHWSSWERSSRGSGLRAVNLMGRDAASRPSRPARPWSCRCRDCS